MKITIHRHCRSIVTIAGFVILLVAPRADAQSTSDVPLPLAGVATRADDADVFHLRDNVAALGFRPEAFSVAAAFSSLDSAGSAVDLANIGSGTFQFSVTSPLVNYAITRAGSNYQNWIGSAIPFGRFASFGYAYTWGNGVPGGSGSSFGLLLRPLDVASVGLTLDTSSVSAPLFGFGVAVRPLAFAPSVGSALTFTADAHLQAGAVTLESVGAHVDLAQTLGIRAWYDFPNASLGIEAAVALGPVTDHSAVTSFAAPASWTAGIAAGISPGVNRGDAFPLGRRILAIRNVDTILPGSSPGPGLSGLFGNGNTAYFRDLLGEISQATHDRRVAAIVIEDLPDVGGDAAVQELASALAAFRSDGRQVYLYGRAFTDSFQFQLLASQADRVSITPTGSIDLA